MFKIKSKLGVLMLVILAVVAIAMAQFIGGADVDGDGLPDAWEAQFGLDTTPGKGAVGDNGAYGDKDMDGLSNMAEYQISEVYDFYKASPVEHSTFPEMGVSDYFIKTNKMTMGAMFTDHDYIEDWWEDMYNNVSRDIYDAHLDGDGDGWSNWAECRFGLLNLGCSPDVRTRKSVYLPAVPNTPVPQVKFDIGYCGAQSGDVIVHAFSQLDMNGAPDATYNIGGKAGGNQEKSIIVGVWQPIAIKGFVSHGNILPGSVKFSFYDPYSITGNVEFVAIRDLGMDAYTQLGRLMGTDGKSWKRIIGQINYATGEYLVDLGYFEWATKPQPAELYIPPIEAKRTYVKASYKVGTDATWPKSEYRANADKGAIREGYNRFFAFMDANNNGLWDEGEPAGVSDTSVANPTNRFIGCVDIGWHKNNVKIGLTDDGYKGPDRSRAGGMRVHFGNSGVQNTRVRVQRTLVDRATGYQYMVLDKVLEARNYLHEGDFIAMGDYGFDWGLFGAPTSLPLANIVYNVYVGDELILTNNTLATSFTNKLSMTHEQAALVRPIQGEYVYSARPTFRWSMPEDYTAFALEISKGGGTTIHQSRTMLLPSFGRTKVVDKDAAFLRNKKNVYQYEWELEYSVGDPFPSGYVLEPDTTYNWRIIALNSKFHMGVDAIPASEGGLFEPRYAIVSNFSDNAWTNWESFRMVSSPNTRESEAHSIFATVKYYGPATAMLTKNVRVAVYNNRAFSGLPIMATAIPYTNLASVTTQGSVVTNAVFRSLPKTKDLDEYYVMAYIDHNTNGVRDAWESWGYANYYGEDAKTPYNARGFRSGDVVNPGNRLATIIIEDCDTDQDGFPDAWEFEQNPGDDFLKLIQPPAGWAGVEDTKVNPNLSIAVPFVR